MKLKNGRIFDARQNNDDFAHLPSNDSTNARTLAPSAPSRRTVHALFEEVQIAASHPAVPRPPWPAPEREQSISAPQAAYGPASSPRTRVAGLRHRVC